MSATAAAAAFVRRLELRDVPESVLRIARTGVLDALACAVAGRGERVSVAVREWVRDEDSAGRAGVWGSAVRSSPARAALANGTAGHALDFDDVNWSMNGFHCFDQIIEPKTR